MDIMSMNEIAKIPNRKRALRPKTRTGCGNCRKRRIKCNEEKPSCYRCTYSGWKCDGYSSPSALTPTNSNRSTPSSEAASPTSSISVTLPGSLQQQRSFNFFVECTVPTLCGSSFFRWGPQASTEVFWKSLVLQTAHHEPVVKHALIALGALHEEFQQDDHDGKENSFAIAQYVRAIELMVGSKSQNDALNVDVALIACILFICFEILRGHNGSALSHIDGGAKILQEYQQTESSKPESSLRVSPMPYVPISILHLLLSGFDLQATQITSHRPRRLLDQWTSEGSHSSPSSPSPSLQIPRHFTSANDAMASLQNLGLSILYAVESMTGHQDTFITTLAPFGPKSILSFSLIFSSALLNLKLWDQAFSRLDTSSCDASTIHMLKLKRTYTFISFSIANSRVEDKLEWDSFESHWDRFKPHFESMLHDSEALISNQANIRRTFVLDSDITMPVFFIAMKCRDPVLRRKAIQLLEEYERQEGLLNSKVLARVAERLVEIEEGDGDGGQMKINNVNVQFGMEGRMAQLEFLLPGDGSFDGKGVVFTTEVLEW